MEIKQKEITTKAIKIKANENNKETGRAFLYIIHNELHTQPYGYIEDVFVKEEHRGKGICTALIKKIIETAKNHKCYKVIATSRNERKKVHLIYEKSGFKKHGIEFRINIK